MLNHIYANSVYGRSIIANADNSEVLMAAANWAASGGSFNEYRERANAFGFFAVRHQDHVAAKIALTKYLEKICQRDEMPRWMRRDIIFKATQYLLEPDIEEVYEYILNSGAYEENEAQKCCDRVQAYNDANDEMRADMRGGCFDAKILELLDGFYEEIEFYKQHEAYLKELEELENAIECQKYGI